MRPAVIYGALASILAFALPAIAQEAAPLSLGESLACVALAPETNVIAIGTEGKLTFKDALTGDQRGEVADTATPVAVAFAPGGSSVASLWTDHSLRFYEVPGGKLIAKTEAREGPLLAFSPDGKLVARLDGQDVAIHAPNGDLVKKIELSDLFGTSNVPTALEFSPDGKLFGAAFVIDKAPIGRVPLYQTDSWRRLTYLKFKDPVSGLALSPDGTLVSVSSDDGTIHVLEVATGKQIRKDPVGASGKLEAIAYSPTGKWLAVGCGKELRIVPARPDGSAPRAIELPLAYGTVDTVRWSADEKLVLAGATHARRAFSIDLGGRRKAPEAAASPAAPATGGVALSIPQNGSTRIDVRLPRLSSFAPLPGGKLAAFAGKGAVLLWDLDAGKQVWRWDDPETSTPQELHAIAARPDGGAFAVAGSGDVDGVLVFDAKTGARAVIPAKVSDSQRLSPEWLEYSPDGKWLVGSGACRELERVAAAAPATVVWDVASRAIALVLPTHGPASFSPDGKTLGVIADRASPSANAVHLYEVGSWSEKSALEVPKADEQEFTCGPFAWSPDGKTLAVSEFEDGLALFDVASRTVTSKRLKGASSAHALAWSPDAKLLALAGPETVLFDAAGKPLRTLGRDGRFVFWRDAKTLFVLSDDGETCSVTAWDLTKEASAPLASPARPAEKGGTSETPAKKPVEPAPSPEAAPHRTRRHSSDDDAGSDAANVAYAVKYWKDLKADHASEGEGWESEKGPEDLDTWLNDTATWAFDKTTSRFGLVSRWYDAEGVQKALKTSKDDPALKATLAEVESFREATGGKLCAFANQVMDWLDAAAPSLEGKKKSRSGYGAGTKREKASAHLDLLLNILDRGAQGSLDYARTVARAKALQAKLASLDVAQEQRRVETAAKLQAAGDALWPKVLAAYQAKLAGGDPVSAAKGSVVRFEHARNRCGWEYWPDDYDLILVVDGKPVGARFDRGLADAVKALEKQADGNGFNGDRVTDVIAVVEGTCKLERREPNPLDRREYVRWGSVEAPLVRVVAMKAGTHVLGCGVGTSIDGVEGKTAVPCPDVGKTR